jgi:polyisoprenoid-binding protein YceI
MSVSWKFQSKSGSKPRRLAELPIMLLRTAALVRDMIRGLLVVLTAGLLALPSARAEALYKFDQRAGSIEFSVGHLGLFTSHGRFTKFDASLIMDLQHPERTRIVVDVDAVSVDMPWQDAAAMLRSAEFFDVQHYPQVSFRSTAIESASPDRYRIRGLLEIRGIKQPIVLDAKLLGRHPGSQGGEVADFVASGQLKRSAFGMTADAAFISDTVSLNIAVRIQLDDGTHPS